MNNESFSRENQPQSSEKCRFKLPRFWRYVLALLLVILLVGGALYLNWILQYRLTTVMEGRMYRSRLMPADHLTEVCQDLGLRTVIDFRGRETDPWEERDALAKIGVRHIHLPSHQVPAKEVVDAFLEIMDDSNNFPVLIHCVHGIGRAGVFSAIFRMEYQGWENERARREANLLGGFSSFDPDKPKGEFLLQYVPRSK